MKKTNILASKCVAFALIGFSIFSPLFTQAAVAKKVNLKLDYKFGQSKKANLAAVVASTPGISFTNPADGGSLAVGRSVLITAHINGITPNVNTIDLYIDNSYVTQLNSNGSGDFSNYINTNIYNNGSHTLSTSITNFGRQVYSTSATVYLGVTPPTSQDTTPPTPPTVSGQATSQSTISLTWFGSTDNVAVYGYQIFRNGVSLNTTNTTTYTDSNLQPNTTYNYTVKAYDAAGNISVSSNSVSITTQSITPPAQDTTPPSTPTIYGSAQSPTSASLSWTTSTDNVGVAGYELKRNGTLVSNSNTTFYNDSSLSPSTTYSYTIRAFDASGNYSNSTSVSITTQANPPAPSTSLAFTQPTNNSTVDNSRSILVSISYSGFTPDATYAILNVDGENNTFLSISSNSATGYMNTNRFSVGRHILSVSLSDIQGNNYIATQTVYFGVSAPVLNPPVISAFVAVPSTITAGQSSNLSFVVSDATSLSINQNVGNVTGLSSKIVTPNTTTNYTITATNSVGTVTKSVTVTVNPYIPPSDTTPPSTPAISGSATSPTGATISWTTSTDNVGVTGYELKRNNTTISNGNVTSYTDSSLTPSTSYTYSIRAFDQAGNYSTSNATTITTPSVPTPPTISSFSVAPSTTVGGNSVTFNFAVSNATSQAIDNGVGTVTGTTKTISTQVVLATTTLAYTMTATNSVGSVTKQTVLTLTPVPPTPPTPDTTPPTAPANLTATTTQTTATLNWSASTDNIAVAGYTIARNNTPLATTTSLTYSDTSLTPSTTYLYTVRAFDTSNNVSTPANISATTLATPTLPTVPSIVSFGVTPSTVVGGDSVSFSWTATSTPISGGLTYSLDQGIGFVNDVTKTISTQIVAATTTLIYTLTATNSVGSVTKQTSLTLTPVPLVQDTTPPSTPSLSVSTTTQTSITLVWNSSTDNVGVTNYFVYRGGVKISTLSSSQNTFNDTGLTPYTEYTYIVYAVDAAGNISLPSNAIKVTTLPTPNSNPIGHNDGIDANLLLTGWTQDPDNISLANSVDIYVDKNKGTAGAVAIHQIANINRSDVGAHGFSYTLPSTLNDGSSHDIWVWANDLTDTSGAHDVMLSGSPATYQNSVSNLPSITRFDLSFPSIIEGQFTQLYVVAKNFTTISIDNGIGIVNSGTVTSVSPATTTTYTVTATNAFGSVKKQATLTVIPARDVTPPTAPTYLSGVSTENSITLNWLQSSDNVGVVGYKIFQNAIQIGTTSEDIYKYKSDSKYAIYVFRDCV